MISKDLKNLQNTEGLLHNRQSVHGFKGSGVQGFILIFGLHLECVLTGRESSLPDLIRSLEPNRQLLGKEAVTVHGLQLSVHGWKNQRISKFIAKMLIRFRSFLLPYSCSGPGNKNKISIFSLKFKLCYVF